MEVVSPRSIKEVRLNWQVHKSWSPRVTFSKNFLPQAQEAGHHQRSSILHILLSMRFIIQSSIYLVLVAPILLHWHAALAIPQGYTHRTSHDIKADIHKTDIDEGKAGEHRRKVQSHLKNIAQAKSGIFNQEAEGHIQEAERRAMSRRRIIERLHEEISNKSKGNPA